MGEYTVFGEIQQNLEKHSNTHDGFMGRTVYLLVNLA